MSTLSDTKYAALQTLTGASVGTINLWLPGFGNSSGIVI